MHLEQRDRMLEKQYLVTHYLVTYTCSGNKNGKNCLVPNLGGVERDGHSVKQLSLKYIRSKVDDTVKNIVSYEKYGNCIYCNEFGKLERSHVIGNTIFRRILKQSEGGFAIRISLSDKTITKDNDSWPQEMLCKICESKFNSDFENYGVYVLREKLNNVKTSHYSFGIGFSGIDPKKIMLYVLSILWRAAYSNKPAYKNVLINQTMDQYLRLCFSGKIEKIHPLVYGVRIRKLKDCKIRVWNNDQLKQLIIPPFIEMINGDTLYRMIYEGYLIDVYLNPISFKKRDQKGFLKNNKNTLFVPYVDIFDIHSVVDHFAKVREIHISTPSKA